MMSPRYHNTKERERGSSGPAGRGGKVLADKQSVGGKGKQSGGTHPLHHQRQDRTKSQNRTKSANITMGLLEKRGPPREKNY